MYMWKVCVCVFVKAGVGEVGYRREIIQEKNINIPQNIYVVIT